MAATDNTSPQPTQPSTPKKRFVWSVPMTRLLISLWEDHMPALRAQKHNAPIYCSMTEKFNEAASGSGDGAIHVTVKQLRHKLENLAQLFKAISKSPTGSAATDCPFYKQLKFLGRLPVNDPSLVEESWQLEVVEEAPEGAQMLAMGPEPYSSDSSFIEGGSLGPQDTGTKEAGPSGTSRDTLPGPSNGRKRTSCNAELDCVTQLLEKDSEWAAKLGRVELKVSKQGLRLQKESVQLQREMNAIMAQYFANKN